MNPIIIKTHRVKKCKNEVVRLHEEASRIIQRYQRETGLSSSFIVSEIIRQTIVQFEEVDDV